MRIRTMLALLVVLALPSTAFAKHLNTSGQCTPGASCEIGTVGNEPSSIVLRPDGGALTIDGDVTLPSEPTGGDAGAKIEFIGLPRIKLGSSGVDGTVDGTGDTALLMDDSPIGEAAPITAGTEAAETTIFRVGAGSYKYTFADTAADNHGIDFTVSGHANVGTDSLGFWLRSSVTFNSGDLDASLDDGASVEGNAVVPAYGTANVWQWMEVDFASDCDAECADVDGVFIQVTDQAPTTFNGAVIYIDSGAIWLDTAEIALGVAAKDDGVLGVISTPDAEAGEQDLVAQAEWTDYFVHYEDGNDFIVVITDESAQSWIWMVAY